MIKTLGIKRFKSIREAEIECSRVNVFIGKPNVGKSNLLEAFSFFTVSNESLESIRLRNLSNLFFNNDYSKNCIIKINEYSITLKSLNEKCTSVGVDFVENNLKNFGEVLAEKPGHERAYDINSTETYNSRVSIGTIQGENPMYRIPLEVRRYLFNSSYEDRSSSFTKFLLSPYGSNIFNILNNNKNLALEYANFFKDYNMKLRLNNSTKTIEIQKEIDDLLVVPIDYSLVADSLRRLIFHMTAINMSHSAVLAFEEPEAHTYAPYTIQFAEMIAGDENHNQFFITTHSYYFLSTLLKNLSNEELSIFFVRYDNDSTEIKKATNTQLKEMRELGVDPFLNMSVI